MTSPSASFGTMALGAGAYSLTPFVIHVDSAQPNHSLATMNLAISGAGGYADTVSFPLLVTTDRGFSDDMERGDNGWTHSGTSDNWHLSAHRSLSPSHSWYCGVEGSWAYSNENDARLVTPWFVSGDSARLAFDQWYDEEQDCDFGMVDINNGSNSWIPLATYTGADTNWGHVSLPLAQWSGQTIRLRFRFLSDYSTTTEGWYVDNFLCEPYQAGIAEHAPGAQVRSAQLSVRSPVFRTAAVSYAIPAGECSGLAVYDVNGRLVAELAGRLTGSGRATWNLAGVESGTYFIRLSDGTSSQVAKVVVAK